MLYPNILNCLYETNLLQTAGYEEDPFCQEAIECLRQHLEALESDIHFLVGETQTDLTFISHTLKSYAAVLSATIEHIAFNKTGAIESTHYSPQSKWKGHIRTVKTNVHGSPWSPYG